MLKAGLLITLFLITYNLFTLKRVYASNQKNTMYYLQFENTLILTYTVLMWVKLRVLYYINNWVYTTNHKRIAVNYYWFVIFSGICGMILATIIRLEMAYPGVGVLAGDSLQYLSVVTAHAVIMVFFMIMPLLFGAFGNFLLPTQLGVHDVAFPRLNSAAFWFLPAGLLMLVQLVCLDRRYQRMNCYNIREIQTLLKSQYSPNSHDSGNINLLLNETILGLRYNLMTLTSIDSTMLNYYRNSLNSSFQPYAILTSPLTLTHKLNTSTYFETLFSWEHVFINNLLIWTLPMFNLSSSVLPSWTCFVLPLNYSNFTNSFTSTLRSLSDFSVLSTTLSNFCISISFHNLWNYLSGVGRCIGEVITPLLCAMRTLWSAWVTTLESSAWNSLRAPFNTITLLYEVTTNLFAKVLILPFPILNFKDLNINMLYYQRTPGSIDKQLFSELYLSNRGHPIERESILWKSYSSSQESFSSWRFNRSSNAIFRYDFKVGNYIPDDTKKLNPHLLTTIKDVTMGIRKPSWFYSVEYRQSLQSLFSSHLAYFSQTPLETHLRSRFIGFSSDTNSLFTPEAYSSVMLNPTGGFYNVFMLIQSSSHLFNNRLFAANTLDQKFIRMFATASLQQRIFANWRQLKFTREAWRCKLLAARHQNTLYKRYLNEDSVVWAVERNAKDVLPGWAMITPFSARSRFTAIGKVDIGLLGVFLVLNSSIVTSANFLVTYRYLSTLNNRKMRDARSFFTEGVMVASWMMIAANPMLAIGILMLLSDRHWQTSFFDYSGGGDTVLFQHMFWFFGHPEVYVIMIPGFGFNNTILSFYLRKRVSARASLLYSMYTIAFLGFFVWGHHMYMVGLAHTTRMLFSTLTVMISVPAATKLMHWCVTLVNSTFVLELPMCFQLLFIFFFVSGGISGMAVAHTGMDILFHDTFYVVGHFHVMLAGSAMFAAFGAFYFYFPAIFGVKYSRTYGYLHCIYYLIGQLMTVIPMLWLGYAAMPRRVLDYPSVLGGWHAVVSAGHMLSIAGMMAFFIMIFDSMRQARTATRNSFGVTRFNTRLNFYIYEGARTWFIQRKGWVLSRFNFTSSVRLNKLNFSNYEYLETTLYSYVIVSRS